MTSSVFEMLSEVAELLNRGGEIGIGDKNKAPLRGEYPGAQSVAFAPIDFVANDPQVWYFRDQLIDNEGCTVSASVINHDDLKLQSLRSHVVVNLSQRVYDP